MPNRSRVFFRLPLVVGAALVASACSQPPPSGWQGYAEGDYVYLAAPSGGVLQRLPVRRGQAVDRGALLFALDTATESAQQAEAGARLQAAQALAGDAAKGRRPAERAVTQAQWAQVRAQAEQARLAWLREQQLVAQGFTSQARLDEARTSFDAANQRVSELAAALQVSALPARDDQRAAAEADALAARQLLAQVDVRIADKQRVAPAPAQVADTFYRIGEWVPAGQPVVALLPGGAVRARFFVPQAELAALATGQPVAIACDGCGAPISAHIDFIASRAEFTPPVIYSSTQRSRLVFMVEARPDDPAAPLKPGQPLDVRRIAAAAR
jgi:HlyD family secretion protein